MFLVTASLFFAVVLMASQRIFVPKCEEMKEEIKRSNYNSSITGVSIKMIKSRFICFPVGTCSTHGKKNANMNAARAWLANLKGRQDMGNKCKNYFWDWR